MPATAAPSVTIAKSGDLYCIPCGGGYTTLGFDVLLGRVQRLQEHLGLQGALPERGSIAAYDCYERLIVQAAKRYHDTGMTCLIELSPQLIGLEGHRVEVVTTWGETERFIVGRSTGWMPIHLSRKLRTSSGGFPCSRTYQSVKDLGKVR